VLEITFFNTQTWLTLGEEIIKYYVKFLSRYCQCCEPDDSLHLSCVYGLLSRTLSFKLPHRW